MSLQFSNKPPFLTPPIFKSEASQIENLHAAAKKSYANGIVLTDISGHIAWVNNAYCEITGYERTELIGQNPSLVASGKHSKEFYAEMWNTILSGETWKGAMTNRNKDGSLATHETKISPIRDHSGNISHFIGIKQYASLDKAVEQSNLLFSAAIEHADDAIVLADLDGKITYVNHSFFNLFGTRAAEFISKPLTHLFSHNDSKTPGRQRELTSMLAHGWVDIFEIESPTEKTLEIRMRVSQIHQDNGDLIGFACHLHNLGEENRQIEAKSLMETRLRQAEKLEAVGQLAAGMAHEINTPTQFVGDNIHFLGQSIPDLIAIAKTLKDQLAEDGNSITPEKRRTLLNLLEEADIDYLADELPAAIEQASDGISRISKIVNAMKNFSHPGTDTQQLVNLNEVLKRAVTVAQHEFKHTSKVAYDLDDHLDPVYCYGGRISQVFLNIIVNAAQAIREAIDEGKLEAGRLTIATEKIDACTVEVRLTDNALGIPTEHWERVFDPFFTTKPVGSGTGQGLAIAYDIVTRQHGGKLFFTSTPRRGTIFHIHLPIKHEPSSDKTQNQTAIIR